MEPENIDALLERANRLLEKGRPADSLRCLDELQPDALDADDRIELVSLRAWALSDLGRNEEALDALDTLLDEFPKSPRLLGALGMVLSNNDELEDARDALEEAIAISPTDEVSRANLALVYEKLRDFGRALELYEQALNLGADVDWVLQREAAALSECGRFADAKQTLKRYLSLVPDDATQWITLGILCSDDEEYDEAFRCYEQAERLDPQAPALRLNWGVSAVRARRLPVARAQLKHLQRIEPRSSRPMLLGAFILEEQGELTEARKIYERIQNRVRFRDHTEQVYALEMAMDFFARHKQQAHCKRLFARAYAANACTVELCESYREVVGEHADKAYWFCLMVEADYRSGLKEVAERDRSDGRRRFTRFLRAFQVIAPDRDEAIGAVLDLLRRAREKNPCVREFVGEEPIEDVHMGLYEVEAESLVFADDAAD